MKAQNSFQESLKKLCTDYVDLLLIHQPAGEARAIGIFNFYQDRFTL